MWKEVSILNNLFRMFKSISKDLYRHFGITTTNVFSVSAQHKRKDGNVTKGAKIYIKRKESIIKFNKEIGFEDKVKQERLERVVSDISGLGR